MTIDEHGHPGPSPSAAPSSERSAFEPGNSFENLPEVKPPTSGFFVQLFLLPALIVFGIMTVWFLFGRIAGSGMTPDEYLEVLASDRKDRWKAASDLAQLLREGSRYTRDRALSIRVTEALQTALADSNSPDPQYLEFLCGAVSSFSFPTGSTALLRAARADQPPAVRRAALIGLANLAHRVGNLDDPSARRDLGQFLKDDALEVRELAAVALGQLGDPAATESLIAALDDPVPTVRYNTASALASLGSTAGMATFNDMLDPVGLSERFHASDSADQEFVDVPMVVGTMLNALRSLDKLATSAPSADFSIVADRVRALRDSPYADVRQNARELAIKLKLD